MNINKQKIFQAITLFEFDDITISNSALNKKENLFAFKN